jgi:hypothetical protein
MFTPAMKRNHNMTVESRWLGAAPIGMIGALVSAGLLLTGCEQKAGSPSTPPAAGQSTTTAAAPAPTDVVGQTIRFGQGGKSEGLRTSGWGDTEKDFTWTIGNSATLSLPVPSATGALTVRVKMSGMVNPPSFTAQPVEVVANGQKVADWQVGALADFQATIPADQVKSANGVLKLEFRTPKAMSPKSVNQGDDARVLGVCCWEVQVSQSA